MFRKTFIMKRFYIIGNPVSHSKSPEIFNYIFSLLNINAEYLSYNALNETLFDEFIFENKCN